MLAVLGIGGSIVSFNILDVNLSTLREPTHPGPGQLLPQRDRPREQRRLPLS